jgi:hypothetical protein
MWNSLDPQPDCPANFAERGVFVPFTTPMLAAARLRVIGGRPEAVIPNPSGGRGVYVLGWSALDQCCAMTLHDRRLAALLGGRAVANPLAVRRAARAVAVQGFAGHAATLAARAAERADDAALRACVAALLAAAPSLSAGNQPLAVLAAALAPLGFGGKDDQAWLPRTASALTLLERDLRDWAAMLGRQAGAATAGAVANRAAATLEAVRAAQALACRLAPSAAASLLDEPDAARAAIEAAERALWLIDGWERLCLLWRLADTEAARATCLPDFAIGLPPLVGQIELDSEPAGLAVPRQPFNQAGSLGIIARNEHVRELSA